MKKILFVIALTTFTGTAVMAGPRGCPGGWGCPPPPCGGWRGGPDRGLANAACIVDIVANGIGMLGTINAMNRQQVCVQQPVYVNQPAVQPVQQVVQPVQYMQPQQVQYVQQPQTTVVYSNAPQYVEVRRKPTFLPWRILYNLFHILD